MDILVILLIAVVVVAVAVVAFAVIRRRQRSGTVFAAPEAFTDDPSTRGGS